MQTKLLIATLAAMSDLSSAATAKQSHATELVNQSDIQGLIANIAHCHVTVMNQEFQVDQIAGEEGDYFGHLSFSLGNLDGCPDMTVEAWFETQQVSDSELKLGYTAWDTTQTNSINDCVGGNCFFTIPDMPLDPYGGAYIAHIQIWDSDYMQVDGDEPSTWFIPLNSDCMQAIPVAVVCPQFTGLNTADFTAQPYNDYPSVLEASINTVSHNTAWNVDQVSTMAYCQVTANLWTFNFGDCSDNEHCGSANEIDLSTLMSMGTNNANSPVVYQTTTHANAAIWGVPKCAYAEFSRFDGETGTAVYQTLGPVCHTDPTPPCQITCSSAVTACAMDLTTGAVVSSSTTTLLAMTNACDAFYSNALIMTQQAYTSEGAIDGNPAVTQTNMIAGQQTSFSVNIAGGATGGATSIMAGSSYMTSNLGDTTTFGTCTSPNYFTCPVPCTWSNVSITASVATDGSKYQDVQNMDPMNPMTNLIVPLSLVANYTDGCGAFNGRVEITQGGSTIKLAPDSPHTETLSPTEMTAFNNNNAGNSLNFIVWIPFVQDGNSILGNIDFDFVMTQQSSSAVDQSYTTYYEQGQSCTITAEIEDKNIGVPQSNPLYNTSMSFMNPTTNNVSLQVYYQWQQNAQSFVPIDPFWCPLDTISMHWEARNGANFFPWSDGTLMDVFWGDKNYYMNMYADMCTGSDSNSSATTSSGTSSSDCDSSEQSCSSSSSSNTWQTSSSSSYYYGYGSSSSTCNYFNSQKVKNQVHSALKVANAAKFNLMTQQPSNPSATGNGATAPFPFSYNIPAPLSYPGVYAYYYISIAQDCSAVPQNEKCQLINAGGYSKWAPFEQALSQQFIPIVQCAFQLQVNYAQTLPISTTSFQTYYSFALSGATLPYCGCAKNGAIVPDVIISGQWLWKNAVGAPTTNTLGFPQTITITGNGKATQASYLNWKQQVAGAPAGTYGATAYLTQYPLASMMSGQYAVTLTANENTGPKTNPCTSSPATATASSNWLTISPPLCNVVPTISYVGLTCSMVDFSINHTVQVGYLPASVQWCGITGMQVSINNSVGQQNITAPAALQLNTQQVNFKQLNNLQLNQTYTATLNLTAVNSGPGQGNSASVVAPISVSAQVSNAAECPCGVLNGDAGMNSTIEITSQNCTGFTATQTANIALNPFCLANAGQVNWNWSDSDSDNDASTPNVTSGVQTQTWINQSTTTDLSGTYSAAWDFQINNTVTPQVVNTITWSKPCSISIGNDSAWTSMEWTDDSQTAANVSAFLHVLKSGNCGNGPWGQSFTIVANGVSYQANVSTYFANGSVFDGQQISLPVTVPLNDDNCIVISDAVLSVNAAQSNGLQTNPSCASPIAASMSLGAITMCENPCTGTIADFAWQSYPVEEAGFLLTPACFTVALSVDDVFSDDDIAEYMTSASCSVRSAWITVPTASGLNFNTIDIPDTNVVQMVVSEESQQFCTPTKPIPMDNNDFDYCPTLNWNIGSSASSAQLDCFTPEVYCHLSIPTYQIQADPQTIDEDNTGGIQQVLQLQEMPSYACNNSWATVSLTDTDSGNLVLQMKLLPGDISTALVQDFNFETRMPWINQENITSTITWMDSNAWNGEPVTAVATAQLPTEEATCQIVIETFCLTDVVTAEDGQSTILFGLKVDKSDKCGVLTGNVDLILDGNYLPTSYNVDAMYINESLDCNCQVQLPINVTNVLGVTSLSGQIQGQIDIRDASTNMIIIQDSMVFDNSSSDSDSA